jgi:hypothetical protein
LRYDNQLLQSWRIGMDTGNPFRSGVLGVMSPQSETARLRHAGFKVAQV